MIPGRRPAPFGSNRLLPSAAYPARLKPVFPERYTKRPISRYGRRVSCLRSRHLLSGILAFKRNIGVCFVSLVIATLVALWFFPSRSRSEELSTYVTFYGFDDNDDGAHRTTLFTSWKTPARNALGIGCAKKLHVDLYVSGSGEKLAECKDRLTMKATKIIVRPPAGLPVKQGSACD